MGISQVFRMVSGLALGLATCVGMSDQTAPTTKGEATHIRGFKSAMKEEEKPANRRDLNVKEDL
jgi:hypothetical protein